jgi:hypothetical protein
LRILEQVEERVAKLKEKKKAILKKKIGGIQRK